VEYVEMVDDGNELLSERSRLKELRKAVSGS
jgi:hypothetical protein